MSNQHNYIQNPHYRVSTTYDSDGCIKKYEYIFDTEEELVKFAAGEWATDHYGEGCMRSHYEHIDSACLTADIDINRLYEMINEPDR